MKSLKNLQVGKSFDLSPYRKTSDVLSLKHLFESNAQECNVIIRVVPDFKIDFIKIRSHIVDNLITASIDKNDLIKLEESNQVISYNVSKSISTIKSK